MQFRRLATILFCDVVESMALSEALDAEAFGSVLQRYFEIVSAALTRRGTVEKFAGDAVMAAFGAPVSHEDDALAPRAPHSTSVPAFAALNAQLLEEHGVELEVRIGFETGEVVATATDARQRLVTGEGSASPPDWSRPPDRTRFRRRACGAAHRPRSDSRAARRALHQGAQGAGACIPAARACRRATRVRAPAGRSSCRSEA